MMFRMRTQRTLTPNRESFWDTGDLSIYLKIPIWQSRKLIRSGLPAVRIGKAYRILPSDVDRWLCEQAMRTRPQIQKNDTTTMTQKH